MKSIIILQRELHGDIDISDGELLEMGTEVVSITSGTILQTLATVPC